jgi:hypothetical protein
MSVELIAIADPEHLTLGKLPTLVADGPKDEIHGEPIPGNYHCLIIRVDGQLVVWDLGSGGGTFVNGSRVSKASLKSGDRLTLGGSQFAVKNEERPRRYLHGVRS